MTQVPDETKNVKQRIIDKMKSWSSKDVTHPATSSEMDLVTAKEVSNLTVPMIVSEDNLMHSVQPATIEDKLDNKEVRKEFVQNSKSTPFTTSRTQRTDSHSCESVVDKKSPIKPVTWDPWNKLGRKNKTDKRRIKLEPSPNTSDGCCIRSNKIECYPDNCGDPQSSNSNAIRNNYMDYSYKPYTKKSVDFKNEVKVVYFTSEQEVLNGSEPLKKGIEQQIRNKEMRKGHVPCTMAAWLKK